MNALGASVYCWSLVALWIKCLVAMILQARERMGGRSFRYTEDARYWRGQVTQDSDLCVRAQSLLRNDSESQPYFIALGGAYLWLGATPNAAPFYFVAYTLLRFAHGYLLLVGRQPHRTRVFGAGLLVLTVLAVHVCVVAIDRLHVAR